MEIATAALAALGRGIASSAIWIAQLLWSFMLMGIPLVRSTSEWFLEQFTLVSWKGKILLTVVAIPVIVVTVFIMLLPVTFVLFNLFFVYSSVIWNNYQPQLANQMQFDVVSITANEQVAPEGGTETTRTEARSAVVDVTAEMINWSVNDNQWMSASLGYKLGPLGFGLGSDPIDGQPLGWDMTPFFDNKAAFQRGALQALRRISLELVDKLGRARGTSQIEQDLEEARGALNIGMWNWYVGYDPFVKQNAWGSYRRARQDLLDFNSALESGNAVFDARADNLMQLLDRITSHVGSLTSVLEKRAEDHHRGWFDFRADDTFMEAQGAMWVYYNVLIAARHDFEHVVEIKQLDDVWDRMEDHLLDAVELSPPVISNGKADGLFMPGHLLVMSNYVFAARANMVELRSILDR